MNSSRCAVMLGVAAVLLLAGCIDQLIGGGTPPNLAKLKESIKLMDGVLPTMLADNTSFVYSTIAELPSTATSKHFRVLFGDSNLHTVGWLDVALCYSASNLLTHAIVTTASFATAGTWAQGAAIPASTLLGLTKSALPKRTLKLAAGDLAMKSASAKFDYKAAESNDAEQTGAVSGKVPTTYDNFFQVSSFRVQANQGPGSDGLDHSFSDASGAEGKDGTKYRKKFFWWDVLKTNAEAVAAAKSGGGEKPWAVFLAQIKDGEMQFTYIMKKASEGEKMVGLESYDAVHDTMPSNNTIKAYSNLEAGFTAGFENNTTEQKTLLTAGKTKASAKLAK